MTNMTNYTQNSHLTELGFFSLYILAHSLYLQKYNKEIVFISANYTQISQQKWKLPYLLNVGYSAASLKKNRHCGLLSPDYRVLFYSNDATYLHGEHRISLFD